MANMDGQTVPKIRTRCSTGPGFSPVFGPVHGKNVVTTVRAVHDDDFLDGYDDVRSPNCRK